ncbi:MAG: (d)CMP kinase [Xanthomonadales bacterium]|nr:(d)CMP kinase [Xanthomonadales bacterium]
MPDSVPVITIDGPGGSGKGTISMLLAESLGWNLLDSGALYRLVAVAALNQQLETAADELRLGQVAADLQAEFTVENRGVKVLLEGEDVSSRLRSEEVSVLASRLATLPAVREALVERQRAFRRLPGLVADGRDMGTVIFPDASLKIYLTASVEERAQRRYKQLKQKGESVNLSRLFQEIEERDRRDRTRILAPLKPAFDSHIIDSSELSVDEVLAKILFLCMEAQIIV